MPPAAILGPAQASKCIGPDSDSGSEQNVPAVLAPAAVSADPHPLAISIGIGNGSLKC